MDYIYIFVGAVVIVIMW